MSSDDEIPDLFPASPVPARSGSARPSPPPIRKDYSASAAVPSRPSVPVRAPLRHSPPVLDSERPSRPLRGPSSGLELDVSEDPREGQKQTAVLGTSDELEFDPMSSPHSQKWDGAESPHAEESVPEVRTLDLEFAVPFRSESEVPALEPRASSPPSAAKPVRTVARAEPSVNLGKAPSSVSPVGSGVSYFPGSGNEIELGGGFDDLDFGGAEAAQLNVALSLPEKGADIPWPIARTPVDDELAVNGEEVEELSGFGPKPKGFLQAPLYALRVYSGLKDLREKLAVYEKRLLDTESRRDGQLGALAEAKRPELAPSERFAALYAAIDRHDELILHKRRAVESADVEGAQALREVQAQIDTHVDFRAEKERLRDDKRAIFVEVEFSLRRHQAALKRIQIEWRNIEQRAARMAGERMPADLNEKLNVLDEQRQQAEKTLQHFRSQLKQSKWVLEEAENDVRLAAAAVQRCEGQKEAMLLAFEGDIAEHSRELDEAIYQRRQDLAQAGRAIVELRGEVPVEAELRLALLGADAAIQEAARDAQIARLALLSMDQDAYRTGRAIWIFGALTLLALLIALVY